MHHHPAGRPRAGSAGSSRCAAGAGSPTRCRSIHESRRRRSPSRSGWCSGRTPPGSRRDASRCRGSGVRRVRAEVLNAKRIGAYHLDHDRRAEVAERVRPGQFVSVAMPQGRTVPCCGVTSRSTRRRGAAGWAGTPRVRLRSAGPGSSWLAEVKAHQFLDVIGPSRHGVRVPSKPRPFCSSPRARLGADVLPRPGARRGKRVGHARGRRDAGVSSFEPIEAKRLAQTIVIATRGREPRRDRRSADLLPQVVESTGAEVIYAAAGRQTLRRISGSVRTADPSQVAVEEEMACGFGPCFTCASAGDPQVTARATTTCARASRARCSTRRGSCGIAGSGRSRAMIATPPEGFPVVKTWPG